MLKTLGAPARRRLTGRKPKPVMSAEPEPVPTSRATLIHAEPLEQPGEWLERLRGDENARDRAVWTAARELNLVVRSHRAAAADPWARDVVPQQALVVRIGYGSGEQVADGHFDEAFELPRNLGKKTPRGEEALAPQERLAAILGGRDQLLAGEELLLRARLDLESGRGREAALQTRVALESLLAELDERFGEELRGLRDGVARGANRALDGDLPEADYEVVEHAVEQMERAVRRRAASALAD